MPLYMKRPSPLTSRVVRPAGQAVPFQFKASAVPKMSLKKGPTSITSKFVAAPMMNPTISGAGSSGSMGNVLGNAAKGALIGGGAKLAYDALTKKPVVVPKTPAAVPAVVKQIGNTAAKTTAKATTGAAATRGLGSTTTPPAEEPPKEEPPVEQPPVEEPPVEPPPEEPPVETPVDVPVEDTTSQDDGSFWDNFDMGWRKGGLITMMKRGGIAHLADGGLPEDAIEMNDYPGVYVSYDADGNAQFMDSEGNPVDDPSISMVDTTPTTVINDDGSTATMNTDGSVISTPTPLPAPSTDLLPADLLNSIKSALPAAGGGALLAALLGSDFGSAGRQNQGVDMSKLSTLTPRTTDFGIGPARFVNYDEYGSQDQMPDVYSNQLYGDLGTPMPMDQYGQNSDIDYVRADQNNFVPIEEQYNFPVSSDTDYVRADENNIVPFADGGQVDGYYSYGTPVDPFQTMRVQAMKQGGLPAYSRVPVSNGRLDFRQGSAVHGPGDGQSDDIPAMLADGEYVFDADTVAALGNGSTKAGAAALDKMRENIRAHKRSAPVHKIPPPAKSPLAYLKGSK